MLTKWQRLNKMACTDLLFIIKLQPFLSVTVHSIPKFKLKDADQLNETQVPGNATKCLIVLFYHILFTLMVLSE